MVLFLTLALFHLVAARYDGYLPLDGKYRGRDAQHAL